MKYMNDMHINIERDIAKFFHVKTIRARDTSLVIAFEWNDEEIFLE